jgi:hypothetical protein
MQGCYDEHKCALALLSALFSWRAALCLRAEQPLQQVRAEPPLPLEQVEGALHAAAAAAALQPEGPDELEGLVRSLGQQLRSSHWVEEELARKAAAGEPLVRVFEAAAAPPQPAAPEASTGGSQVSAGTGTSSSQPAPGPSSLASSARAPAAVPAPKATGACGCFSWA